jgi:hypothetical protein
MLTLIVSITAASSRTRPFLPVDFSKGDIAAALL